MNTPAKNECNERWRKAHPEQFNEIMKANYQKNKEAWLDRNKRYREENKEKIKEKKREYYIKNKEKIREKQAEYKKNKKIKELGLSTKNSTTIYNLNPDQSETIGMIEAKPPQSDLS